MATIILPGIGSSGEAHWQTIWERATPGMIRFQPASWDEPDLTDWMQALDQILGEAHEPALLVSHSLSCLLVAHWAAARNGTGSRGQAVVCGAFLVAIPDPDGPAFPRAEAASFRDVPQRSLPFPSLVVASRDDPNATLGYARAQAAQWGASFVDVGPRGHLNEASGLGAWQVGARLLEVFRDSLGDPVVPGERP